MSLCEDRPNHYKLISTIGQGAYGAVYKGVDASGGAVALKCIEVRRSEGGCAASLLREVATLRQLSALNHPNIVKLLDIVTQRNELNMSIYLVFEFVEQDLGAYLESHRRSDTAPSPVMVRDLTRQLLLGLEVLHEHCILHRDIKPQNLLIHNCGRLKITDMGLARVYTFVTTLSSTVVTTCYRAPELFLTSKYDSGVDMWSAGCVMAELLTLHPIFLAPSERRQLVRLFEVLGLPDESEWPSDAHVPRDSFTWLPAERGSAAQSRDDEARFRLDALNLPPVSPLFTHLLNGLLRFRPEDRWSAAEALRHSYFSTPPRSDTNVVESSSLTDDAK